jgi:ATP-dependent DNA helicase HFM1/MER3
MVDEVHLLREQRGAVLEVVLARTRRFAPSARLVAVSASVSPPRDGLTQVPNIADISAWLKTTPESDAFTYTVSVCRTS